VGAARDCEGGVMSEVIARAEQAKKGLAGLAHVSPQWSRVTFLAAQSIDDLVAECRRLQDLATAAPVGSSSDLAAGVVGAWKENPLRKPVSERFMRHYYGASKGAERVNMNQNNRADLVPVISETLVETERKLRVAEASLVRLRERVREALNGPYWVLRRELEALLGETGDGKTNGS
jgi:hypothetical protein